MASYIFDSFPFFSHYYNFRSQSIQKTFAKTRIYDPETCCNLFRRPPNMLEQVRYQRFMILKKGRNLLKICSYYCPQKHQKIIYFIKIIGLLPVGTTKILQKSLSLKDWYWLPSEESPKFFKKPRQLPLWGHNHRKAYSLAWPTMEYRTTL